MSNNDSCPVPKPFHSGRCQRLSLFLLLPLALATIGADKGCVTQPPVDTIVMTDKVTIKGNISEFDATGKFIQTFEGSVTLKVNGAALPTVNTINKVWKVNNVPLNLGVNRVTGTTSRSGSGGTVTGTIPEFIYERKSDLSDRGQQKVFLDWSSSGINDKLKQIATHTLNGPVSGADQNAFVTGVKEGVKQFVIKAYKGKDVVVVSAPGADVHVIKFHGEDSCGLYGESPGDYKNLIKAQQSEIYIGTFKCVVVDDDRLLTQTPAKKTDSLVQRIKDISTFIGRTSAHEFGHSLGLTAEGESKLHGCEGFHNCEAYDTSMPTDRFDTGHYIMDPGPKSPLYARIGVASATDRKAKLPRFNAYNASYLGIIHKP